MMQREKSFLEQNALSEIKTMMLLEQELCYNVFPLKKGGSLHMKLQFLLSEEDQKRIREMRDSVLKRRSFSGMLLDHSESTDPIVEPYFGLREKFTASKIGMEGFPRRTVIGGDPSNLYFPQTISKSFSAGMLSEISSQRKSKPAMHYESLGNKVLEGTKLIKETKNESSYLDPPYSAKSDSYMPIDNGRQTIGYGKSTRLVAGISNKRKDFVSVDAEKGPSIISIIRNFEAVREKGLTVDKNNNVEHNPMNKSLPLDEKIEHSCEQGTLGDKNTLEGHSIEDVAIGSSYEQVKTLKSGYNSIGYVGNATSFEGFNTKIDMPVVVEKNNEESNPKNKSLSLDKKIEHSCQQGTLGDENALDNHSIEQVATIRSYEQVEALKSGDNSIGFVGNTTSFGGFNTKIDMPVVEEKNNEERNPKNKSLSLDEKIEHSCQQGTLGDENALDNHSIEQVATGSSYEQIEALKYGYNAIGFVGNATLSEGFNRKINIPVVDQNNNEECNPKNKSLPLDENMEHSCQQGTLGDENTLEGHLIENIAIGSSYEQVQALKSGYNSISYVGNATLSEGFNRKINMRVVDENNNEECNLTNKSFPLDEKIEHSSLHGTLGDKNTLEGHSIEQIFIGSSYEQVEALKSGYNSIIYVGNTTSSEGFNRKIDMPVVDQNNNEEYNPKNKSLPLDENIEHSCQHGTLGDENTLEGHSIEQISIGSLYEQVEALKSGYNSICYVGNVTSSKGFNRTIDMPVVFQNNNEECNPKNRSLLLDENIEHSCQHGTLGDENSLEGHSIEHVAIGSSYEQVEALKSGFVGISGAWIPRHVCITTGSKLLREFAVSLETNPIESSSLREADTKKDGVAFTQGNESNVPPSSGNSCIENPPSSLNSNGVLMEQGVWFAVITVACGLLLKGI